MSANLGLSEGLRKKGTTRGKKIKEEEWHGTAVAGHSGLGSDVSLFASLSSSLSRPARATVRRTVKGRSPRLGRKNKTKQNVNGDVNARCGEQPSIRTTGVLLDFSRFF